MRKLLMRGKKSDPEFVSQFISKCLQQGAVTTEEMVKRAKQDIQEIDNKIIEVEKLKIVRSKILDVILTLDKPKVKTEEGKLLPLFKLQYPHTCKKICDQIIALDPNYNYSIMNLKDPEILFCIKQLIESKILNRDEDALVKGDRFTEYMSFVFHEVQC